MKITGFNQLIVTKDAAPLVELFEELGFEQRHHGKADSVTGREAKGTRMKHPNGFYVDIAENDVPQDRMLIRINVDDFDKAYQMLISKGFTDPAVGKSVDTATNKNAMLLAPSGFAIHLCHHIKK